MRKTITTTPVARRGLGYLGILSLIFVAAKLWGVIAWSWWLVFAPPWGPFAILLALGLILLLGALAIDLIDKAIVKRDRKRLAARKAART